MKINNGLAHYKTGEGEPLLLMPYPHASTYVSMINSPLVNIFVDMGFCVLTFDPPGIFNSDRKAEVDLQEMLACTNELLDYYGIKDTIWVVGHSQAGFCSIAFAVEFPNRVKRLLLIGSVSGWPMVMKSGIQRQFSWLSKEKWQLMCWGTGKMLNLSNLYIHKKLDQLVKSKSFVDESLAEKISIEKTDREKPDPVRAAWMLNMRKGNYDYSHRLQEINAPTLICVGKYDPQTPVQASQELGNGIPGSEMVIFENSGHYPFIEERDAFIQTVRNWLN